MQLYTSGSTGKPKGVQHSQAGYMIGAATTFKYVFDYQEKDVYWCTADCGWITGHSYVTYGEGSNMAMSLAIPRGISPQHCSAWLALHRHDEWSAQLLSATARKSAHEGFLLLRNKLQVLTLQGTSAGVRTGQMQASAWGLHLTLQESRGSDCVCTRMSRLFVQLQI